MADIDASSPVGQRGRGPAKARRTASAPADSRAPSSGNGTFGGSEATRRTGILETANAVIATSGLRTSLQQIADAAGILAGSLYPHFESKEAILVELIRRYHAELDRIGEVALERLDGPDPRSAEEQIIALGCDIAR